MAITELPAVPPTADQSAAVDTSNITLRQLTATPCLCTHRSPWNTTHPLRPPPMQAIHPTTPTGSQFTSRDTLPEEHRTSTLLLMDRWPNLPRHHPGSTGRITALPLPSNLFFRIKMTDTTRWTKMERPGCGMFEGQGGLRTQIRLSTAMFIYMCTS